MPLVGVEEMTVRFEPAEGEGLKQVIAHAIREAIDQTARSDGDIRTLVRFKVGGHTVTAGPDDDPEVKYLELKHLEPKQE